MKSGLLIKSVTARQVISDRIHPAVEATVITEDGSCGIAIASAGVSVGEHEVQFIYDGGERWGGKGVLKAVKHVNEIINPALKGVAATKQNEVDDVLITLDGTPNKKKLGGNATASVSAAVLKAGAIHLGIPLYRHIGGPDACILPTPGVLSILGSTRYGGSGERSGGKPSYSFMCYGFDTFSEAVYACWQVRKSFSDLLYKYYFLSFSGNIYNRFIIPTGVIDHDQQLWDLMVEAIEMSGNTGKIGIQIDVAASTYYDRKRNVFAGLFSREEKTKDQLIDLYRFMASNYPFIVLEDPLHEDDFAGHALLTRELGIQIVGDDLFTTNIERLKYGMRLGACNTILLKVNQIGTISEAFATVKLAHSKGFGVMPCSSRGEGSDIADYAVGLGTGSIRESGLDFTANRLLYIESELGEKAKFLGKGGFKLAPLRT